MTLQKIIKTALLIYAVIAPTVIIYFINQDKKVYEDKNKALYDSIEVVKLKLLEERNKRQIEIEKLAKSNALLEEKYNNIKINRPRF